MIIYNTILVKKKTLFFEAEMYICKKYINEKPVSYTNSPYRTVNTQYQWFCYEKYTKNTDKTGVSQAIW